ncbi:MAG TPA: pitrilysin family protein [Terriglobales bacterium]|nr:pitrilysin family protein [Terriglobales bacterium]
MRRLAAVLILMSAVALAQGAPAKSKPAAAKTKTAAASGNLVALPSPSPLYQIQIMVRAGSANDPAGKEGTASLVADALIEGGFGNAKNPTTKEKLAEITRPWGDAALPEIRVDKEATLISVIVPKDSLQPFLAQVLRPMLQQPLFQEKEIERLRKEALVNIQSRLRFEQQELLGLLALDNAIFDGTVLGHVPAGTVKGLNAITRQDLVDFYKKYYTRANVFIATTISDAGEQNAVAAVLPAGGTASAPPDAQPAPVQGRSLTIITQPNAIATGIHLGFPIDVKRGDADYWPLFVANVFLGTHRDSFGHLYQTIREARGYNYGDYSYIEYLAGRPFFLFPPPGTPRTQQYFSIWIRPVAHQYTHFVTKAATAELDNFIQTGLTPEQVESAKNKARTLYLKYSDSKSRQLGYKLDDMFYGTKDHGYLDDMLKSVEAVTPEQVNAAIKKHLQVANLKYVIVTNDSEGAKLADDIANNTNVTNKSLAEYHISEPVPPEKQALLKQDDAWKAYPLNIARDHITIVKAEQMFEGDK